jgi:hypothetical protein
VQLVYVNVLKERLVGGVEGVGEGGTVLTRGSPDLQESTTKQISAVCIIGVNKIAPNSITPVATYIYMCVIRLFKDLTARHIYIRRLAAKG